MTITVANARDFLVDGKVELPENAVYVGRAAPRYGLKASPLANPYHIGQWDYRRMHRPLQMNRSDCSEAYAVWLSYTPTLASIMELTRLADLARRAPLVLVCWCETWDGTGDAPGKCHAEILRRVLEGMA